MSEDGVVASALVLVEIAEVEALLEGRRSRGRYRPSRRASWPTRATSRTRPAAWPRAWPPSARPPGSWATASARRRRGAARRARTARASASRPRAEARLRALGAARALVSLTHGRAHAAASVLLLREESEAAAARLLRVAGVLLVLAAAAWPGSAYAPAGDASPAPVQPGPQRRLARAPLARARARPGPRWRRFSPASTAAGCATCSPTSSPSTPRAACPCTAGSRCAPSWPRRAAWPPD